MINGREEDNNCNCGELDNEKFGRAAWVVYLSERHKRNRRLVMHRSRYSNLWRSFVVLGSMVFLAAAVGSGAGEQMSDGIGVAVDIVPTDAVNDHYRAAVVVTDLRSGRVIGNPFAEVTGGHQTSLKFNEEPPEGTVLKSEIALDVFVEKGGTRATYRVSYTKAGILVATSKGSLSLR
jgi:hypothetical protein